MSQNDLGDAQEAETTLRRFLTLAQRTREVLTIANAKMYLASVLADRTDLQSLQEAQALAKDVIGTKDVNPFFLGIAQIALAITLERQGDLVQADSEATNACRTLTMMPGFGLHAQAVKLRILIARGDSAQACATAAEGLARLMQAGCGGVYEVRFRLAASEAYLADGQIQNARNELRQAMQQLEIRATKIPDLELRARYLNNVADNARLQELAQRWLGDAYSEPFSASAPPTKP